jgi:hypothetical protein
MDTTQIMLLGDYFDSGFKPDDNDDYVLSGMFNSVFGQTCEDVSECKSLIENSQIKDRVSSKVSTLSVQDSHLNMRNT